MADTDSLTVPLPTSPSRPATRQVTITRGAKKARHAVTLTMRPSYMYRRSNWEIGRAAELDRAAQAVRPFRPGDRFAAWRKSAVRQARIAERRAMGRGAKGGKKR